MTAASPSGMEGRSRRRDVRPRLPLSLASRATIAAGLVSLLMLAVQGGLYVQLQRAQQWASASQTAIAVAHAVATQGDNVHAEELAPGVSVRLVESLPRDELRAEGGTFVEQLDGVACAWTPLDDGRWVQAAVRMTSEPQSPLLTAHVLLSLCILLIVLLLSRRFARHYLSARIEDLARFTDALAAGANGHRRPLDDIDDELGRLSERLNRLADRLDMADKQVELERRSRDRAMQKLRVADRLASVGKVASTIAHDLGTPLNVISGQTELLQMRAEPDSAAAKTAQRVHEQAMRMRDIIENVLGYARQRPAELAATASRIAPVIDDTIDLLSEEAEDAGVRLQVDECVDACAWFAPSSLLQALTNLVQNAIRASDQGDVVRIVCTVRELRDEAEIPSGMHAGDHALVVEVIDEGIGMTPDEQARVFEPFYTTRPDGHGTGLGLPITTEIISSFDGALTVTSIKGEGSTFSIWLRCPDDADC